MAVYSKGFNSKSLSYEAPFKTIQSNWSLILFKNASGPYEVTSKSRVATGPGFGRCYIIVCSAALHTRAQIPTAAILIQIQSNS